MLPDLSVFDPPGAPVVMVASHERSGTHFTMNMLAKAFGYDSEHWIDLYYNHVNINYYQPDDIAQMLSHLSQTPIRNLIKTHHDAGFMTGVFDKTPPHFHAVYVFRDPLPMLYSFWRYCHFCPWVEGPKRDDFVDFLNAPPEGRMLSYQSKQVGSLAGRWAHHVSGWMQLVKAHADRIHVVRYEDLKASYPTVVQMLSEKLGGPIRSLEKPDRTKNIIGQANVQGMQLDPAVEIQMRQALDKQTGGMMSTLGYGPDKVPQSS